MVVGERDEHTLIMSNLIEVGEEEGVLTGFKGIHMSLKVHSSSSLLMTLKSFTMWSVMIDIQIEESRRQ